MRGFRFLAAIFVFLTYSLGDAHADFMYQFAQSAYQVNPGQTVDVAVFLRETVAPGDMSLLATEGLFGAGVRIRWDVPPVPTQPARVLAVADIFDNPAFGTVSGLDVLLTSAGLAENVGLSPDGVLASGSGPNFDILLGTFRFTAGTIGGEVTHLRATDFDPASFDTLTNINGTPLDDLIADANATITVKNKGGATVPEPSSLPLLFVGMTLVALWRHRPGPSL